MIDGIIKADGTSRLMRAELPATYEEFRAQCRDGTQPLDILFNALGWSQLPTFLNKENLLKDPTASMFSLGADAVPDDVLKFLGKYNQHWWHRTFLEGKFVESGTYTGYFMGYQTTNVVQYSSEIGVDSSGNVVLKNPVSASIACNDGGTTVIKNNLLGKYVTGLRKSNASTAVLSGVYYVPSNAVIETNSKDYWGQYTTVYLVEYKDVSSGFDAVRSSDRNAYPDNGIVDGVEYAYLGIPFENAVTAPKIATGSYTGTGKYGSNNKNSLTFDFEPQLVILANVSSYNGIPMHAIFQRNQSSYIYYTGGPVSWSGKTMSWYTTETNASNGANYQLNTSGKTYNYIAIG